MHVVTNHIIMRMCHAAVHWSRRSRFLRLWTMVCNRNVEIKEFFYVGQFAPMQARDNNKRTGIRLLIFFFQKQ